MDWKLREENFGEVLFTRDLWYSKKMFKIYFSKSPNNSSSTFSPSEFLSLSAFFLPVCVIVSCLYFYLSRFFLKKFNIEKFSRKKQAVILVIVGLIIYGLIFGLMLLILFIIILIHENFFL